jgi:hypothetical protein
LAWSSLADGQVAVGEVEAASSLVVDTEVSAARDLFCVLAARAIVAEARDEIEQARYLYPETAERWAEYGIVLEERQAHLGLAPCLLALSDGRGATEPLDKARGIFSRLGPLPPLNQTDAYLERAEAAS